MPRVRRTAAGQIKGLPDKLVQLRLERGLNQREMADRLDLPYRSLQDYEQGKATPGGLALLAYRRFGASLDWLLDEQVPESRNEQVPESRTKYSDASSQLAPLSVEIPFIDSAKAHSTNLQRQAPSKQTSIVFPRAALKRSDVSQNGLAAFINADDAMTPIINPGALVVAQFSSARIDTPGLYVLRSGHGLAVRKIVAQADGRLLIRNVNHQWPTETLARGGTNAEGRVEFWLAWP
jgi:transcriptional regulator with XRE-family HTH domain